MQPNTIQYANEIALVHYNYMKWGLLMIGIQISIHSLSNGRRFTLSRSVPRCAYSFISEQTACIWYACRCHNFTCYLTERTQRVKILDTFSGWHETKKGVPQGSVLGPSLFNIFINDIYGIINKASLFNYADDNTLAFTSSNLDEIKTVLPNETQTAIEWFKLNMMEANPDKFQVMLLSKKETNSSFNLDVNGSTLIGEPNVKLLVSVLIVK